MAFVAALSGLLAGEVGRFLTKGLDLFSDHLAHKRKIELAKLAHEQEIDLKDIEVFGKAQTVVEGQAQVPQIGWVWLHSLLVALAVTVEVFTRWIRPGVTVMAIVLMALAYDRLDAAAKVGLVEEAFFLGSAIIRYWYGYREDFRKRGK